MILDEKIDISLSLSDVVYLRSVLMYEVKRVKHSDFRTSLQNILDDINHRLSENDYDVLFGKPFV